MFTTGVDPRPAGSARTRSSQNKICCGRDQEQEWQPEQPPPSYMAARRRWTGPLQSGRRGDRAFSRRRLILCHKDVPPFRRKMPQSGVKLSVPQIHDVSVPAQPHVVTEVPAIVVRVLIDYDLVTIPQPVVDEAV